MIDDKMLVFQLPTNSHALAIPINKEAMRM